MSDAILDACCLINLYATGDLNGFLTTPGFTWHVPVTATTEALYIRTISGEGEPGREPIILQTYIDAGQLAVCKVRGDEEAVLYVRFAADLDDGEAMALAIAKRRGWVLATDDRKAQRFADRLAVPVLTTPELVQRWTAAARLDSPSIRALLVNIQLRARFLPAESAPGYDWWIGHTGS